MLIQLPNGQWLNPSTIQAVVSGPNNVRVSLGEDRWIDLPGKNQEETDLLRDQIAEQVNKALYEGGK